MTLTCVNLAKTYGDGDLREQALSGVTLSFAAGESCVLLGPSGSGKTTLLSILGCLLSPSDGEVLIGGHRVNFESPEELVRLRRTMIGFVFQHAQLLPFLTVTENLTVVAANGAVLSQVGILARVRELLERLGIADYGHRKPAELSGGQRQRVAVARALLLRPQIILADEPTAALDWENGQDVMRLLTEHARNEGSLVVAVTHDKRLVKLFDRVIYFESGRVIRSESGGEQTA